MSATPGRSAALTCACVSSVQPSAEKTPAAGIVWCTMLVFVVAQGLFLSKYMEDKDVTEDK